MKFTYIKQEYGRDIFTVEPPILGNMPCQWCQVMGTDDRCVADEKCPQMEYFTVCIEQDVDTGEFVAYGTDLGGWPFTEVLRWNGRQA